MIIFYGNNKQNKLLNKINNKNEVVNKYLNKIFTNFLIIKTNLIIKEITIKN